MSGAGHYDSLRPLIPGIYLPSVLFSVGMGAMTPMVAVSAVALGGSPAAAALLVSMVPIGQILGDLPAGAVTARLGDRGAMVLAVALAMTALAACALAPSVPLLAVAVLLVGVAKSVYGLARQTYLTDVVAPMRRARAMSAMGGSGRIGLFLGPFAGALLVHGRQEPDPSYWLAVAMALTSGVVMWFLLPARPSQARATEGRPTGDGTTGHEAAPDGATRTEAARSEAARSEAARKPVRAGARGSLRRRTRTHSPAPQATLADPSTWQILRDYRAVFATLGVAIVLVGAVRGVRQTVLPLWTEHLGFDPSVTSLVFGIAGAVDMALFYPTGKIMDRFGRLWVAVPSMAIMTIGLALLPWTHSLGAVVVIALVLGVGNGLGSGVLMTLGADTAPEAGRSRYLGVCRMCGDAGMALGPLGVSLGAALGSLAAGISAMAAVGAASVAALGRWVPRWSWHANATTRRRRGLIT